MILQLEHSCEMMNGDAGAQRKRPPDEGRP
jgi:hypothetical protein